MSANRTIRLVEALESRRLLSVGPSLHHGLLNVQGSNRDANVVVVQLDVDDATKLNVTFNGATTTYNLAEVSRIRMQGGKQSDFLEISELNGVISIPATLQGNAGNDTLISASGNDVIKGLAGDDSLVGNSGNDKIYGGVGNDTILAGEGNDSVTGDNGDDSISGGTGDDLLKGLAGKDSISGDDGNDTIDGGSGNDSLVGGDGVDAINARSGRDSVDGGIGADILLINKKLTQVVADPEDTLV